MLRLVFLQMSENVTPRALFANDDSDCGVQQVSFQKCLSLKLYVNFLDLFIYYFMSVQEDAMTTSTPVARSAATSAPSLSRLSGFEVCGGVVCGGFSMFRFITFLCLSHCMWQSSIHSQQCNLFSECSHENVADKKVQWHKWAGFHCVQTLVPFSSL